MTATVICAIEERTPDDVIQTASELAAEAQARLLLVHVRADPKPSTSRVERERRRHREHRLGQAVLKRAQSLLPEGVQSEGRVLLGATTEQLTATAAAEAAELIVVGASRRGPVASRLFASVSRTLSRQAPCSLVIVPREPDRPREIEHPVPSGVTPATAGP